MELKDLVPPMKLCKQIPKGKFDESALVWEKHDEDQNVYEICPRLCCFCNIRNEKISPAPTLAEIVSELTPGEDGCGEITQFGKDKRGWFMMASFEGNDDGYGSGIDTYEEKDDANPATAALKLWLEVNKPDMPDRTDRKEEETDENRGTEN